MKLEPFRGGKRNNEEIRGIWSGLYRLAGIFFVLMLLMFLSPINSESQILLYLTYKSLAHYILFFFFLLNVQYLLIALPSASETLV